MLHNHFAICYRFNPIASSLLVKALSRIASMESVCSGQPIPPKEALQTLADASGGDVRSAVNALQFAAKKGTVFIDGWVGAQKIILDLMKF